MHATLRFSRKIAQLTVLLVSVTFTVVAQQKSEVAQAPFNSSAYRVGERLTYNVDFSHFISAAHVELFVASRGVFFNRDGIQLRAHVETTGVVNVAVFGINNDYITYVDSQTGLPFRAQQVVREAGRASEVSHDYNQPAGLDAIPSRPKAGDSAGFYDLLSAIYRVRAMPLVEGGSYYFSVRNDSEEYHAEVKVNGRKLIKTNVGSFSTIVTRVNVKNGHDYNLRVYFSDDERHVPVLLTTRYSDGEIRAELAGSEVVAPVVRPATPITVTPATKPVPTPTPAADDRAKALDLPFRIGEQLNYQVYLGNNAQPVGTITFAAKSRGRYFNHDGLQLAVTATTTATGSRVFPVNDQLNSFVDPQSLLPFRTELSLSEGKYRTVRTYEIDQNRGAATMNSQKRIDIPVGTHDLLSAIYAIRTFDLSPKKKNAISILATTQPRTLLVESDRRDTIDMNGQKVSAILLKLTTDDPQSDRLQLRIWVGDDSRHLPLRITAVTELGPVRADLAIVPVTSQ